MKKIMKRLVHETYGAITIIEVAAIAVIVCAIIYIAAHV